MAIIDVSIVPIGTETPSVSAYVANIHKVLEKYEGEVKYQLTPMNTIIEGELPLLLKVVQEMHEVPFANGISRVATTIRIDDRRDKKSTMEGKLASVKAKLEQN
ncbi:MTH1187 family thiamine-binding protein [Arthrobacter citreus]|nr:MTH1187 family thiamine-binding protein [Arthrobacter citreus]